MSKINVTQQALWKELKADLKANSWTNGKITTALRIMLLSMSFHTLFLYRLQARSFKIPVIGKTLSRIFYWFIAALTTCEISSMAVLEGGVSLPHPKGITIGKGAVIAKGAAIYQNVTLGMREGHQADQSCPVIEQGATIYSGAVIVGGITIGENAIVGANSVVLKDVPANKTAVGIPAKVI